MKSKNDKLIKGNRLNSDYLICQELKDAFQLQVILHTGNGEYNPDPENKKILLNEDGTQFIEINDDANSVYEELVNKNGHINVFKNICLGYASNPNINKVVIDLYGIDQRIKSHNYNEDQKLFIRDMHYLGNANDSGVYLTYKTMIQVFHMSGLLNNDLQLQNDVKIFFLPNYGFVRRHFLDNFIQTPIIKSSLLDDVEDFMILDASNNKLVGYINKHRGCIE